MAKSLADMPIEILTIIIKYLSPHSVIGSRKKQKEERNARFKDWSSLMKTSKLLCSVTIRYLYQRVGTDESQLRGRVVALLFRSLLENPDLRHHVQELYIKTDMSWLPLPKHYTKANLSQTDALIKSLISLTCAPSEIALHEKYLFRELKLHPINVLYLLLASQLLPNIRCLSIKFASRALDRIVRYFRLPGSLQSLRIKWTEGEEENSSSISRESSISFDASSWPNDADFSLLKNADPGSSQSLDATDTLEQLLCTALTSPENLQSLYYEQSYTNNWVDADLPRIRSLLESSVGPTLSSLTLIMYLNNPGDWRQPQQLEPFIKDEKPLGSFQKFTNLKKLETQIEFLCGIPKHNEKGELVHNLGNVLPTQLEELRVWSLTFDEENSGVWFWKNDDITSLLVDIAKAKGAEESEGLPPTSSLRKITLGDPRNVSILPFYDTPIHDYEIRWQEEAAQHRHASAKEWSSISSIRFEYP